MKNEASHSLGCTNCMERHIYLSAVHFFTKYYYNIPKGILQEFFENFLPKTDSKAKIIIKVLNISPSVYKTGIMCYNILVLV